MDGLKKFETGNDLMRSKVNLLIEQIELACMHVQHRRYSPELLSMCVLSENCSFTIHQQTRDEDAHTVLSERYIKKTELRLKCRHWF